MRTSTKLRPAVRPPAPPVRPSRVARGAARERRRRLIAAVAGVALVAAAARLLFPGEAADVPRSPPAGEGQVSARTGASPIVAISLQGAAVPLMALVSPSRTGPTSVLTIPADMELAIPGLGEGTSASIAEQEGEGLRVSLSNTVGTWIDHYLVVDLNDLASLADAAGGFAVTLPGAATLSGATVGPGPVTMTGAQVSEYLGIAGPKAFTRWEILLPGVLRATTGGGLTGDSDDLEAVDRLLPVGEVRIDTFPTRIAAGSARVPDYGALDALMARNFGVKRPPVAVLVQNGVGRPGLGAEVAARIVPKGFRVVLSTSAETFDERRTQVVAGGPEHVADAERAVRALGVGVVGVTRVPSGVADITIVIGKDLTA